MVGAGRMGQAHARVLRTLSDVRITEVVDFVSENAAKVATTLGANMSDLDGVLANPAIDAVFITTPHTNARRAYL